MCVCVCRCTFLLLFSLQLIFLQLFRQLLFLLLLHISVQMFGGVAEGRSQQDLTVLTQLVSDPDKEILKLHCILEDLRVRPESETRSKQAVVMFQSHQI